MLASKKLIRIQYQNIQVFKICKSSVHNLLLHVAGSVIGTVESLPDPYKQVSQFPGPVAWHAGHPLAQADEIYKIEKNYTCHSILSVKVAFLSYC